MSGDKYCGPVSFRALLIAFALMASLGQSFIGQALAAGDAGNTAAATPSTAVTAGAPSANPVAASMTPMPPMPGQAASATAPMPVPVTPVTGTPAAPPALSAQDTINASINAQANTPITPPLPGASAGQVAGATRPLATKQGKDEYYDSRATVPSKQMAPAVGPRKVNPAVEPGQTLVVVEGVRKATDKEAVVASADRALNLGFYDSALGMYNNLYKKNPRDPRVLMGRAVAQQKLGMNDAAIDSYNRLLDVTPDNVDAMVNMLGLLKQKDPGGALKHMVALEGRFPDDPGLAAQIGMAEGEAGNYSEAMRYLGKASALQPENPQHAFNMAVLADRQGDAANAVKYYKQVMQESGDTESPSVDRNVVLKRLAVLSRR